jgi:hypothetical protein
MTAWQHTEVIDGLICMFPLDLDGCWGERHDVLRVVVGWEEAGRWITSNGSFQETPRQECRVALGRLSVLAEDAEGSLVC